VRVPAVCDGTIVSQEQFLSCDPVIKVEVSDTQDDLEFAAAFLPRVGVHEVDLRRDAVVVVIKVVVRPDESHAVVVHHRHARDVLASTPFH